MLASSRRNTPKDTACSTTAVRRLGFDGFGAWVMYVSGEAGECLLVVSTLSQPSTIPGCDIHELQSDTLRLSLHCKIANPDPLTLKCSADQR